MCSSDLVDSLIAPTPGPLADAEINMAYSSVITVSVPADTTLPIIGVTPIDSARISAINGLPPGLTFQCNPASCGFPGGTLGCILLSGTVTDASLIGNTYPLSGTLEVFAIGQTFSSAITGYSIDIVGGTSTNTLQLTQNSSFELYLNQPNPFQNTTNIGFNSPTVDQYEFRVLNMLGEEVHYEKVEAQSGKNNIVFDGAFLPAGFYLYMLSNGKYSSSSRMIISDR